ncbi:UNVERIFIED_CONTAM: hypothetical protein FKN15_017556 [Acipenser sinensis]
MEASGTATLPPSGQVAASQGIPSQPSQSLTQALAHLAEEVFTNAPRERSGSTPSLTSSTSVAMTLFKRRASLQSILDPLPCMGKTRGPLEVLLDTALEDMGIPLDADKADPHVPRGPEQVPPDLPCGELNSPNNSTYCAYKDGAFLDEAALRPLLLGNVPVIMSGDFNCALRDVDQSSPCNDRSSRVLSSVISDFSLCDAGKDLVPLP